MQSNNILKDFLLRRKISESVITDFSITWGINKMMGECIIIPIYNEEGIFVFNKYRRNPLINLKPKYIYDNGGKLTLYGAYKLNKNIKQVIITEGEMDCLVCWSHNIQAVSSTGGAMSFNQEMADLLCDYDVVLCFDNDEPGGKGMAKLLDLIPTAKILFMPDRPGVKDISDYVANGGDLHKLLNGAKKFCIIEDVIEDRANRVALWQNTYFHDCFIENHREKEVFGAPEHKIKGGAELDRAKAYPISSLIKFNRAHKACCLWHNEKTPSMHYYEKNNRVYCFSCGKGADAIDVFMQLNNCSFQAAIEFLK